MGDNMKKININTPFVTLGQFLKIAHIIQTGGEAKMFLLDNEILIDGVIDNRRGRKLYPGTKIKCLNNEYEIVSE